MYNFNAVEVKDRIVEWIREFFEQNGPDSNAVVGISGGKDSSIVAALCVEALGKDRVFGVLMPCGEQADIDMARLLVNHLGIRNTEVNVKDAVEGVLNNIKDIEISIFICHYIQCHNARCRSINIVNLHFIRSKYYVRTFFQTFLGIAGNIVIRLDIILLFLDGLLFFIGQNIYNFFYHWNIPGRKSMEID